MTGISSAVRADLEHLLNLVDMLPSWSSTSFWSDLTKAEGKSPEDHYFMGKIHSVRVLTQRYLAGDDVSDHSLEYLSQYVLMFFDREDHALFEVLDRLAETFTAPPGRIGRRWAADATATAWRLYVRGKAGGKRDGRGEEGNPPPWEGQTHS